MAKIKEIAFIDPTVSNIETLIGGLRSRVVAVRLDPAAPAMAQIARALDGHTGLDAIHIISHGIAGQLCFSFGPLSLDTIDEHRTSLAVIGQTLSADGGLLLWSCEAGQGQRGVAFVEALARAIGAEVAAARGLVGAAAHGGRWGLDVGSAAVQAGAPLTAIGIASYEGVLAPKNESADALKSTDTGTSAPALTGNDGGFMAYTRGWRIRTLDFPGGTLQIDSLAPVVNAAAAPSAAFTLAGLDDSVSGTVTFSDGVNPNVVVAVTGNGTYHANLSTLADGTLSASFAATDSSGNPESASASTTLLRDAGDVTLSLAPVVNAAAAPSAAFTLAGLDDSVSGTVTFSDGVNPNVVVAVTGNGTYHANLSTLADGTLSASFAATDSSGNPESASASTTLLRDAGDVTLSLAPVVNAAAAPSAAFTLAGLDDSVSGTVTFSDGVNPNVVVAVTGNGTYHANLSTLADGTLSASFAATDSSGNPESASASTTLLRDAGDVTLSLAPVVNAAAAPSAAFTLAGLDDSVSGTVTFSDGVNPNVVVAVTGNGTYHANLSTLADGTLSASFAATDSSGNPESASASTTLLRDAGDVTLSLAPVVNAAAAPSAAFTLAGLDDSVSGTVTFSDGVNPNVVVAVTGNGTYHANLSTLADGTLSASFAATDSSGNPESASASTTLLRDAGDVTLSLAPVVNAAAAPSAAFTLAGLDDSVSGTVTFSDGVNPNVVVAVTGNGTYHANLSTLADGTLSASFAATDSSGNPESASASTTLLRDAGDVTLSLAPVVNAAAAPSAAFTLAGLDDSVSGTVTFSDGVNPNVVVAVTGNGTYHANLSTLADGTLSASFAATDSSGNPESASASTTLLRDAGDVTLSLAPVVNAAAAPSAAFTLAGLDDSVSGTVTFSDGVNPNVVVAVTGNGTYHANLSTLADGTLSASFAATDSSGNPESASASTTLLRDAGDVTLSLAPVVNAAAAPSAAFTLAGLDDSVSGTVTFSDGVNPNVVVAVTGNGTYHANLSTLADGTLSASFAATDSSGNPESASASTTLLRDAGDVTLSLAPVVNAAAAPSAAFTLAGLDDSVSGTVTFSDGVNPNVVVAVTGNGTYHANLSTLADGTLSASFAATDSSGNPESASASTTLLRDAGDVTLSLAPVVNAAAAPSAAFTLAGLDDSVSGTVTFSDGVNPNVVVAVTGNGTYHANLSTLADGTLSASFAATDSSGNPESASASTTLLRDAGDVTLSLAPVVNAAAAPSAAFTLAGLDDSVSGTVTFSDGVNPNVVVAVTGNGTYHANLSTLADGTLSASFAATDSSGNPESASASTTLLRDAGDVTLSLAPVVNAAAAPSAAFTLAGLDDSVSGTVTFSDGVNPNVVVAVTGNGTYHANLSTLADGTLSASFAATDSSGNPESASASTTLLRDAGDVTLSLAPVVNAAAAPSAAFTLAGLDDSVSGTVTFSDGVNPNVVVAVTGNGTYHANLSTLADGTLSASFAATDSSGNPESASASTTLLRDAGDVTLSLAPVVNAAAAPSAAFTLAGLDDSVSGTVTFSDGVNPNVVVAVTGNGTYHANLSTLADGTLSASFAATDSSGNPESASASTTLLRDAGDVTLSLAPVVNAAAAPSAAFTLAGLDDSVSGTVTFSDGVNPNVVVAVTGNGTYHANLSTLADGTLSASFAATDSSGNPESASASTTLLRDAGDVTLSLAPVVNAAAAPSAAFTLAGLDDSVSGTVTFSDGVNPNVVVAVTGNGTYHANLSTLADGTLSASFAATDSSGNPESASASTTLLRDAGDVTLSLAPVVNAAAAPSAAFTLAGLDDSVSGTVTFSDGVNPNVVVAVTGNGTYHANLSTLADGTLSASFAATDSSGNPESASASTTLLRDAGDVTLSLAPVVNAAAAPSAAFTLAGLDDSVSGTVTFSDGVNPNVVVAVTGNGTYHANLSTLADGTLSASFAATDSSGNPESASASTTLLRDAGDVTLSLAPVVNAAAAPSAAFTLAGLDDSVSGTVTFSDGVNPNVVVAVTGNGTYHANLSTLADGTLSASFAATDSSGNPESASASTTLLRDAGDVTLSLAPVVNAAAAPSAAFTLAGLDDSVSGTVTFSDGVNPNVVVAVTGNGTYHANLSTLADGTLSASFAATDSSGNPESASASTTLLRDAGDVTLSLAPVVNAAAAPSAAFTLAGLDDSVSGTVTFSDGVNPNVVVAVTGNGTYHANLSTLADGTLSASFAATDSSGNPESASASTTLLRDAGDVTLSLAPVVNAAAAPSAAFTLAGLDDSVSGTVTFSDGVNPNVVVAVTGNGTYHANLSTLADGTLSASFAATDSSGNPESASASTTLLRDAGDVTLSLAPVVNAAAAPSAAFTLAGLDDSVSGTVTFSDGVNPNVVVAVTGNGTYHANLSTLADGTLSASFAATDSSGNPESASASTTLLRDAGDVTLSLAPVVNAAAAPSAAFTLAGLDDSVSGTVTFSDGVNPNVVVAVTGNGTYHANLSTLADGTLSASFAATDSSGNPESASASTTLLRDAGDVTLSLAPVVNAAAAPSAAFTLAGLDDSVSGTVTFSDGVNPNVVVAVTGNGTYHANLSTLADGTLSASFAATDSSGNPESASASTTLLRDAGDVTLSLAPVVNAAAAPSAAFTLAGLDDSVSGTVTFSDGVNPNVVVAVTGNGTYHANLSTLADGTLSASFAATDSSGNPESASASTTLLRDAGDVTLSLAPVVNAAAAPSAAFTLAGLDDSVSGTVTFSDGVNPNVVVAVTGNGTYHANLSTLADGTLSASFAATDSSGNPESASASTTLLRDAGDVTLSLAPVVNAAAAPSAAFTLAGLDDSVSGTVTFSDGVNPNVVVAVTGNGTYHANLSTLADGTLSASFAATDSSGNPESASASTTLLRDAGDVTLSLAPVVNAAAAPSAAFTLAGLDDSVSGTVTFSDGVNPNVVVAVTGNGTYHANLSTLADGTLSASFAATDSSGNPESASASTTLLRDAGDVTLSLAPVVNAAAAPSAAFTLAGLDDSVSGTVTFSDGVNPNVVVAVTGNGTYHANLSTLADGTLSASFAATDSSGNPESASASTTLLRDAGDVTLSLAPVVNAAAAPSAAFTLAGLDDSVSGTVTFSDGVNPNVVVAVTGNGTYHANLSTLADGTLSASFAATDSSGNPESASASTTLLRDAGDVTLSLAPVVNAAAAPSAAFTLAGLDDSVSGTVTFSDGVNPNVVVAVTGNGTYHANLSTLADGTLSASFAATDSSGNPESASASTTLLRDAGDVTLSLAPVVNAAAAPSAAFTLAGLDDSVSGTVTFSDGVNPNVVVAVTGNGTYHANLSTLADGTLSASFAATDSSGNPESASASTTLLRDAGDVTLSLAPVVNAAAAPSAAFTLAGLDDSVSGTVTFSDGVNPNVVVAVTGNGTYHANLSTLADGTLSASFAATDSSGNPESASASTTLLRDAGDVTLSLAPVVNAAAAPSAAFTLAGLDDSVSGTVTFSDGVNPNVVVAVTGNGTYHANLSTLADGTLSASFAATDSSGNPESASASTTLLRDAGDVTLSLAPVVNAAAAPSAAFTLAGLDDSVSGTVTFSDGVNPNVVVAVTGNGTYHANLSTLADGTLSASFAATDSSGNPESASASTTLLRDAGDVTLSLAPVVNAAAAPSAAFTLAGLDDSVSGTVTFSDGVNPNVVVAVTGNGTYHANLSTLADGTLSASFAATDSSGNPESASASTTLLRDAGDVTLSLAPVVNAAAAPSAAFTLAGLDDSVSGTVTFSDGVNPNVVVAVTGNGTYHANLSTLADGTLSASFAATDSSGNPESASASTTLLRDAGDVTLSLAPVVNAAAAPSAAFTLAGLDDSVSGTVTFSDGVNPNVVVAVTGNGTYHANLSTLADGTLSASFAATDSSGNPESASASTTLLRDAGDVTLSLAPVVNAAAAPSAAFTLAGLDDSVSGTVTFSDGVNPNVVVAVTGNGTYHANLSTLADGTLSASFAATDSSGNPESASASTTLLRDAGDVTLSLAPVVNAAAAPSAAFTLAGLDDSVSGTVTFSDGVNPNVVVAVTGNGTYHANLSTLADGTLSASFAATDSSGNPESASASTTLLRDAGDVTLSLAPVVNAAAAPSAAFTLAGLDDSVSGTVTFSDGVNPNVVVAVTGNGTYHANLSTLADGTLSASFAATDSSGNPESASASTTLLRDAGDVTLSLAPVVNAAAAPSAAFTLAGLDDSVSGTVTFSDGVNPNVVVAVTGNGTYHANLSTLADGTLSASFAATDSSGNPESASASTTLDETAPTLTIGTIAGDDRINASEAGNAGGVTISGTALDGSGTGVNGQSVTVEIVNGSNAVVDSYTTTVAGGAWSVDVTKAQAQGLADGSYTVKADVSDVAGNPAVEATHSLTVDETAPTLTIGTIAGDDRINASEAGNAGGVTISGTALDGSGTGVNGQSVTVEIVNGSNAVVDSYTTTVAGGAWSVDVTKAQAQGLADGSYTVKADVSDVAGNPAVEATHSLTVDETAPTLTIGTIAGDDRINASEAGNAGGVTISGTALDGSGTGVNGQSVTVEIVNGSNAVVDSYTTTVAGGAWSVDVTKAQAQGLADGSYTVKADVSDVAGNPAVEATHSLTVDETAPTLTIGTIAGDDRINASEAGNAGGVTISGTALDGSGTGVNGQSVTVEIVNGSNAVVDSYTTTVAGGAWSVDVTKAQAQGLADGSYTVKADVSDVAGNPAVEATHSLTVDETAPTLTIGTIAGDDRINASEAGNAGGVTISGTALDGSGTGVNGQSVTVEIVNGSNAVVDSYTTTVAGGAWSVDVTKAQAQGLADGSYTVKADVSDVAGNPAVEATHSLTVDETAPTLTIGTIAGDDRINASEAGNAGGVTISGTALDGSGTGVNGQSVTVEIVNGSNAVVDSYTTTVAGGAWSVDVTKAQAQGLADGSYTVKADVSDVAGNPAVEATHSLTVDETAPTLTIGTIAGDDRINASEAGNAGGVTISGTALDGSGTGVNGQSVTVEIVNGSNAVVDSYTTTVAGGAWSVDVTKAQAQGLADGSYTVKADVSDVAGNPAVEATHSLTVDETAPTLTIGTIAGDDRINASEAGNAGGVTISGTALDGSGTGVNGQSVTVEIVNGSNAVVDSYTTTVAGGAWSVDVTKAQAQGLADGSYTVKADVSDVAGNPAVEATHSLTVDETAPTLTIGTIAGDDRINASEAGNAGGVTISGTALDGSGTGVNGQSVTVEIVNGSNAVVDSYTTTVAGGAWSVDVTKAQAQGLADGSYTVKADVSDVAGNPAVEATHSLTVDETAPTLTIGTIAGDDRINASEAGNAGGVTISGTALDGSGTGVNGQSVTVEIVNGSNAVVDSYTTTVAGGAWSVDVTKAQAQGLADGSYTVKADVSDVAGNPAVEATHSLTVDETAPTLTIGTIAGDDRINASEAGNAGGVTISGTALDGSGTGVNGQSVTVEIVNGSNAVVDSYTTTVAGGAWSVDVTKAQAQGLADGSYTVKADVSDVAGNPAVEATHSLTVDETAPTLTIGTIAGDDRINASEAGNAGGVTISGTALDGSGTGVNGQSVTVEIVNGSNAVVDSYTTTVAGGAWSVDVTKAQAQGLADGSYTVKADVSDVAGNPAVEATHSLTVDETAPTLTIGTIAGDDRINASEAGNAGGVTISGTALDGSGTGVNGQSVTVEIVNGSNAVVDSYTTTVAGGAWSVDVTKAQAQGLADGSYTVKADVSDVAGNPAVEATHSLTVDETAPTLTIGTIAGDDRINASEAGNAGGVTISGTALDGSGTGVNGQSVTVEIVNGSNAVVDSYTTTVAGGAWSVDVTKAQAQGLADGSYTVKADVSDVAGNPAVEATHSLTVDETAPTLTIGTIAGDDRINASEAGNAGGVTISGTALDGSGTGVNGQSVTVEIVNGSNAVVDSYTTTVAGGAWSVDVTKAQAQGLADGSYTVKADVSDVAGNPAVEATHSLTVDETAPTAPAITSAAPVSGSWNLSGTAEANSTVTVFDGVTQVGTAVASGSGTWSLTGAASTSVVRSLAATATDVAGNTGPASASWIEGTSSNDTFIFASEAALAAPAVIAGDGGADTISITAAATLIDSDFTGVSGVQTLALTGASTVALGTKAASAGITALTTGAGATSVTDTGAALSIGASALADNIALSLSGSTNFTVTGLQGDISGSGVTGALNVTTVAVATGLSVATGSGSNTINASALTSGEALTMTGSSAATITLNGGNLSAGSYAGNLAVALGAADTVTTGSGNDVVTLGSHTGGYTINLGAGTNTVDAVTTTGSATINASGTPGTSDSLTGAGSDTLVLTGTSGALDLNKLNAFTGFATVSLNGSGESLTLKSGQNLTVNGGGAGDAVTLATHAGTDTIDFTAGTNTVDAVTTTGSATINASGTAATSDSLTGAGSDTLALTGTSGALDLNKLNAFTGFTTVSLNGSGESLTLTSGQNLTVNGGGAGDAVTLATHAGTDTIDFTAGTNTVDAVTTTGSATINASGTAATSDSLTGAGSDTLALTGTSGALDLNKLNAFTGFTTVSLNGSGESLTLKNGQALSVAGGSGNTVTLGTGNDTVSFTNGTNTINATSTTLNAGDSLTGGSGTNTLALTGGGTINLNSLAAFTGFENVTVDNANTTLTLHNAAPIAVSLGNGTDIVTGGSGAANTTVTLGTGTDTVNLSAGSGTNTVNATALTLLAADHLTGGSGPDTLALTGGGTINLNSLAAFTGFENVTVDNANTTLTLHNAAAIAVDLGNGTDIVTGGSGAANTTVTLGTGTDTVNLSAGSGTNTVNATASTLLAADHLTGGSGPDTLALTGGGTINLNSLAAFTGFENVTVDNANTTLTLHNAAAIAVDLGNGTDIVTGGSGAANTTVTLGTGTDTVNLSAGSGTDTVNATASTLLAADSLTGGSGTNTLALTGGGTFNLSALSAFSSMNVVTLDSSGGTVVLRPSTTLTVDGVSGANNILDLSHGTGPVTINLGSTSFGASGGFNKTTFSNIDGVIGTKFADTITANNSGDTITPGGGADLIKLGSGADTLVYEATSDSTPASFNTIGVNGNPASTDFTPGTDKIDLTAISAAPLTFQAAQLGGTIAAHTIGWVQSGSGANTVSNVYVNISGSTENLASADMEIHLLGQKGLTLTATDFIHH